MSAPAAPNPAPSPTVVIERPPPGLGRGAFEGPLWIVVLLAALALGLTALFYVRRFRRPKP